MQQKPKIQRAKINFEHDMKKHGIEKHIQNVQEMKCLLENGSDGSGYEVGENSMGR